MQPHKLLLASYLERMFDNPNLLNILKDYKKLAFIPTASILKDWPAYFKEVIQPLFNKINIEVVCLEISTQTQEQIAVTLSDCDMVYVGGGNTYVLLEHIKKSGFAYALKLFLAKGGLYIGSSAGACVATPDISAGVKMEKPEYAHLDNTEALGLFPWSIIAHFKQADKYGEIANEIAADLKAQHQPAIMLQDHQALYIENGVIEIIG